MNWYRGDLNIVYCLSTGLDTNSHLYSNRVEWWTGPDEEVGQCGVVAIDTILTLTSASRHCVLVPLSNIYTALYIHTVTSYHPWLMSFSFVQLWNQN